VQDAGDRGKRGQATLIDIELMSELDDLEDCERDAEDDDRGEHAPARPERDQARQRERYCGDKTSSGTFFAKVRVAGSNPDVRSKTSFARERLAASRRPR